MLSLYIGFKAKLKQIKIKTDDYIQLLIILELLGLYHIRLFYKYKTC